ncbi:MAG: thiol-disulfide oxidoreductase DCC family protein [Ignavibacteria bacterium]|nr:thiol-disulfide oxidoreductase DCC family protein [Ignavibacteria bacterium]
MANNPVILFDGVCNLCNASVNFIMDRDKDAVFRFASLQSDAGKELMRRYGKDADKIDTVVLIHNDRVSMRSEAAIRIGGLLPFPYPLAKAFLVIPSFIRDRIYDYVAANRYKWFGKKESCRMPDPESRSRFLE